MRNYKVVWSSLNFSFSPVVNTIERTREKIAEDYNPKYDVNPLYIPADAKLGGL